MALNQTPHGVLIVNERDLKRQPDGASVHQVEFLRALSRARTRRKDKTPTIVLLSCDDMLDQDIRRLVRTVEFRKRAYGIGLIAGFLSEIKKSTVVYTREFNPVIAILTHAAGRPLVIEANGLSSSEFSLSHRGGLLSKCWGALLRLEEMIVFRLATSVIAVTPYLRRAILEDYRVDPGIVQFIPNAVDCERFSPAMTLAKTFETEKELKVMFVGSFQMWHGADDLTEIARELSNRGRSARFFLVGLGPAMSTVLAKARELGVKAMFVCLGHIPNDKMPAVLEQADLCIYTPRSSKYTARIGEYSLKVLEWMAAGKPIISYSVPGVYDLLGNGAGILVPSGDVTGVVDAIMDLTRNPALAEELGTEARRRACDYYDWNKVVDRILEVMEETHAKKLKTSLLRVFPWVLLLFPEMAAIALRRHLREASAFKLRLDPGTRP